MPAPPRLAVLLSGGGSTLQNLIDRIADGRLPATIVGVLSSRPDAFGLERARRAGLPTAVVAKSSSPSSQGGAIPLPPPLAKGGPGGVDVTPNALPATLMPSSSPPLEGGGEDSTTDYGDRVFEVVRRWAPDLVILAGWVHLLRIPPDFRQKVLNVHPSLLPAFGGKGMYGRRVHEAVIAAGETESGCTVHYADDTYDTGPIVLQRRVPVLPTDTPEALAARVQAAECEAYPEAIRRVARVGEPGA